MGKKTLSIFLAVIFFISSYGLAQDASDIIVPSGFRVEKVLDTNRCPDPQNIAFLPSGEFLVANMFWRIQQVSPEGAITTRAKFLTNNGPMPFDIQVTPEGEIYFTSTDRLNNPGLYRLDNDQPVLVTETPQGWWFDWFTCGEEGNFYASVWVPGTGWEVAKISDADGDGQYEDFQPLVVCAAAGIACKNGFLYIVVDDRILKYDLNGNPMGAIIEGLIGPYDLAVDSEGNCYTIVGDGEIVDGYGTFAKSDVIKVSPLGAVETIVDDMKGSLYISLDLYDVLYISEFHRQVISKVIDGTKIDVTQDTGTIGSADIAFDVLNRPYISPFRFSQLKRLDPDTRTLEAVTPVLGEGTQTIGVDGEGKFYLSEYLSNGFFIVDPLSGIVEQRTVPWSRMLRFDAYGRLVIVQNTVTTGPTSDDISTTLGLYDIATGELTPYISGSDITKFLFDRDQNMYARYRRWEGIIKVNVPENPTDPPFSSSDEPLFYDLKSKNSEIRYFDLNVSGQLLIPLVDTGEIILGEADGSWNVFASGFDWPGYVRFDRNGVLYVACPDGVYRIIGRSFVVPSVIQRLQEGISIIRQAVSDKGLATSLCKIVESAIASLKKGNITAAIKQLKSFILTVRGQSGKKIPSGVAESLIIGAETIIAGLSLL